jgi:hypothetical protein
MPSITQEFPSAPMGRRVVATLFFALVVIVAVVVTDVVFYNKMGPRHVLPAKQWVAFLVPGFVAFVVMAFKFRCDVSATSRFRIEDNVLVLGKKRYPLAGLSSIARDSDIMHWAIRVRGNGGLGAIRGRYWSKRVGKFEAFLTGTENAVVLRWPDKVVAVSPADTEFFIYSARAAAGLK